MYGFYSRKQKDKLTKYTNLFFNNIIAAFNKKDRESAQAFFNNLYPSLYINKRVIKKSKDFLKNNKTKIPQLLKKQMLESTDEMQRSLKILDRFGS